MKNEILVSFDLLIDNYDILHPMQVSMYLYLRFRANEEGICYINPRDMKKYGLYSVKFYYNMRALKKLGLVSYISTNKYYIHKEGSLFDDLKKDKYIETRNAFIRLKKSFFFFLLKKFKKNSLFIKQYFYIFFLNNHYLYPNKRQIRCKYTISELNQRIKKGLTDVVLNTLVEKKLILIDQDLRIHTFSDREIKKMNRKK